MCNRGVPYGQLIQPREIELISFIFTKKFNGFTTSWLPVTYDYNFSSVTQKYSFLYGRLGLKVYIRRKRKHLTFDLILLIFLFFFLSTFAWKRGYIIKGIRTCESFKHNWLNSAYYIERRIWFLLIFCGENIKQCNKAISSSRLMHCFVLHFFFLATKKKIFLPSFMAHIRNFMKNKLKIMGKTRECVDKIVLNMTSRRMPMKKIFYCLFLFHK